MMEHLGNILTVVLSVTTIIATAGVGLMFGSLKTLRDTAEDLRNRVSDLEKERAEDKARIEATEVKLDAAERENGWLRSTMQGRPEWIALTDQLEQHHREAINHWERDESLLNEILTAVQEAS
jgi:hypothetical protein